MGKRYRILLACILLEFCMILIDMLQVNKLQEDFRSSNSGIVHQNVHWHLETLSVRYLGWWKFCSTASNFALAFRHPQCGILHIDSQAQLRNGDRCGWLKAARTKYRWVHLVKIFAVTLVYAIYWGCAFEVRSSTSLWKTCMYACMTSLLPFSGFCVLVTCHWNEWLSNCLKRATALLYNFRTREPLLIFLNWLRHLSVIWRDL